MPRSALVALRPGPAGWGALDLSSLGVARLSSAWCGSRSCSSRLMPTWRRVERRPREAERVVLPGEVVVREFDVRVGVMATGRGCAWKFA